MYQSDEYKKLRKRMDQLFDSPIAAVVKRTGKSRPTVAKFFNQDSLRYSNWEIIYDACLALIEEKEVKLQLMFDKLEKVIKSA